MSVFPGPQVGSVSLEANDSEEDVDKYYYN